MSQKEGKTLPAEERKSEFSLEELHNIQLFEHFYCPNDEDFEAVQWEYIYYVASLPKGEEKLFLEWLREHYPLIVPLD